MRIKSLSEASISVAFRTDPPPSDRTHTPALPRTLNLVSNLRVQVMQIRYPLLQVQQHPVRCHLLIITLLLQLNFLNQETLPILHHLVQLLLHSLSFLSVFPQQLLNVLVHQRQVYLSSLLDNLTLQLSLLQIHVILKFLKCHNE